MALPGNDGAFQNIISDSRHQQNEAIYGGWRGSEMVLPHPTRGKGKERKPKEKVQVCPEDSSANLFGGLEKVMVIVPIDAEVDEA